MNSFQVNFIVTNKNKTLLLANFFYKSVKILPYFALCEGHPTPKPEKLIFENIGFIYSKERALQHDSDAAIGKLIRGRELEIFSEKCDL